MSFRLAIATTTYKRPELTKAVVDWWAVAWFQNCECYALSVG